MVRGGAAARGGLPRRRALPLRAQEIDLTREIAQGIIDLITKCDQTSLQIMQNDDIDDTAKKGAMTSIQEIKNNLLESAEKVKKIKNSFCKKEEKELQ